ncbi:MAG TPA: DUF2752 domain-containing protein [Candidatus Mediterraneibacter colneyensis]|nr:DUF2752 domain-containing protein [Candidatus Mediterraneibacter colneyensis]
MLELARRIRDNRKMRVALVLCAGAAAGVGALYLYFHNPHSYPLPCLFYVVTGFYCPGCGAGRACYSILHFKFLDAFCYNPLMTLLLPLIGLYIAARALDWMITGGNHIDKKISTKVLMWVLIGIFIYGVLRNIPVFPFTLLAPGGMWQIFS